MFGCTILYFFIYLTSFYVYFSKYYWLSSIVNFNYFDQKKDIFVNKN